MAYKFRYNSEKNALLLLTRGVGFEDIIEAIGNKENLLDIIENPNKEYNNQYNFIVSHGDYVYYVPCVLEGNDTYFMKTIIPSRKYKKLYLL